MPAAPKQWPNVDRMRSIPHDELLTRYRSSSVGLLAKELGVTRGTLRAHLRSVGITRNSEGTQYHYTDKLRKEAVAAYERGDGTLQEIATKFGISHSVTLNRWVHKYGEFYTSAHNRKELHLLVIKLKKEVFKLREELKNERANRTKSAA